MVEDVFRRQRAYRALRPDPVPDDVIEDLLQSAVYAPSAENRQPWHFVVVSDPSVRSAIAQLTATLWEKGGRAYAARHLTPKMLDEVDAWANGGLGGAPVMIVVCGDTTLVHESLLASSIYPAVQNLLLAAIAAGLGSLLSTLPLTTGAEFGRILGLPEHVKAMALVPVGYPEQPLGPSRRIPAVDRMHRDKW